MTAPASQGRPDAAWPHRPPGIVSLADMARSERAAHADRRPAPAQRADLLLPVHRAVSLIDVVILIPFADERIEVRAEPDQIGWLGEHPAADPWIGVVDSSPVDDLNHVTGLARTVTALLDPVVEAVGAGRRLPVGGTSRIAYDAVLHAGLRLERHGAVPAGWAALLLAACGRVPRHPHRTLEVRADAGPAIPLPVPRTCCVLAAAADASSCPTCPQHRDDQERLALCEAWLRSLDGDDFLHVAGRSRRSGTADAGHAPRGTAGH